VKPLAPIAKRAPPKLPTGLRQRYVPFGVQDEIAAEPMSEQVVTGKRKSSKKEKKHKKSKKSAD